MSELTGPEAVYGKRTLTNGNVEWFGVITGRHLFHPSLVDFNTPCSSNSEGQQLYNFNEENYNEIIQNNR